MSKQLFLRAFAVLFALWPAPLPAQLGESATWLPDVSVNSEVERYLRALQVAGEVPLYPWSIRGLFPVELERLTPRDTTHPWAARYPLSPDTARGLRVGLIRPESRLIYNSAFPFGYNDGAVWAGRGITASLEAGFQARYGPITLQIAPVVFWSQNADFELMPNGLEDRLAFADPNRPRSIDLPQRFGDAPYGRIDPGQSTLRLDVAGIVVGISTANQHWGPATEHPILLGNNAPGFLHSFVGTGRPVSVGIGQVHGRLVWGRLDQSDYAELSGPNRLRLMAGAVGIFTPRGIDGLEVGIARFYHMPWDSLGRRALKPLEPFTKVRLPVMHGSVQDHRSDRANQLASLFARWIFPNNGLELYGEFGREDHSWDLGDLMLEPDHNSGFMLGFSKLLRRSDSGLVSLRGEVLNTQRSHIMRERGQAPFYVHSGLGQGHTTRGQVLGSTAGYGGGGTVIAADVYHSAGRWTVEWSRIRSRDRWRSISPETSDLQGVEVIHALGAEAVWFRGPLDLTTGVRAVYNLNRHYGEDALNLNLNLGVRYGW